MDATCFTRSQCLSTSWGVVTHGQGESEMLGMEMDLWAHSKAGNSRPYFVIFSQWNYLKMIIELENDAGITPLFLNVSHRDRSPFLSCFSFITSFAQFWSSYNPLTFRSPFMSVLCKHWGRASDEEQAGPRGALAPRTLPYQINVPQSKMWKLLLPQLADWDGQDAGEQRCLWHLA